MVILQKTRSICLFKVSRKQVDKIGSRIISLRNCPLRQSSKLKFRHDFRFNKFLSSDRKLNSSSVTHFTHNDSIGSQTEDLNLQSRLTLIVDSPSNHDPTHRLCCKFESRFLHNLHDPPRKLDWYDWNMYS
jgi:hypothetical protein